MSASVVHTKPPNYLQNTSRRDVAIRTEEANPVVKSQPVKNFTGNIVINKVEEISSEDTCDIGPDTDLSEPTTVSLPVVISSPVIVPPVLSRVQPISQLDFNPHFDLEYNRLLTFNRWFKDYISKEKLALCGFYYCGGIDTVKCQFCRVEIGQFDLGDDPLTEHKRWAPNCPLITRRATANIAIDEDAFTQYLGEGIDECGFKVQDEIIHPDFAIKQTRLDSFKHWPVSVRQRPEELADAGLFYLGKGDQVKCYTCGGGLKDWEPNDVPWEEHALWYGKDCMFVKLIKGEKFIKEVKDRYDAKINEDSAVGEVIEDNELAQTKKGSDEGFDELREEIEHRQMCKICYANELDTILMPCMHVIACGRCALTVKDCPVCRKTIAMRGKIFFS